MRLRAFVELVRRRPQRLSSFKALFTFLLILPAVAGTLAVPAQQECPTATSAQTPLPTELSKVSQAIPFLATAYSLKGRTASGEYTRPGVVAADPRILPLGSVVRVHAEQYSGIYHVRATGGRVRGRHIDIYLPSTCDAIRFGRRIVRVEVLRRGVAQSTKARTP